MPEGPECYQMHLGLKPLIGQKLNFEWLREHRQFPTKKDLHRLNGAVVKNVECHGKRIGIILDRATLTFGAGMSGFWHTGDFRKHDIIALRTGKQRFAINDARRFGFLRIHPVNFNWHEDLGPSLMDAKFALGENRASRLAACFTRPNMPIKVALLDQHQVASQGNMYASETLWHIRVHPETPVKHFTQWARLARVSYRVLHAALAGQGTTIRGANKYRTVDGHLNRGLTLAVYDRAGKPCYRCTRTAIEHSNLGGRSTYFCPRCQPAPGD